MTRWAQHIAGAALVRSGDMKLIGEHPAWPTWETTVEAAERLLLALDEAPAVDSYEEETLAVAHRAVSAALEQAQSPAGKPDSMGGLLIQHLGGLGDLPAVIAYLTPFTLNERHANVRDAVNRCAAALAAKGYEAQTWTWTSNDPTYACELHMVIQSTDDTDDREGLVLRVVGASWDEIATEVNSFSTGLEFGA